jgi:hypothetical protein
MNSVTEVLRSARELITDRKNWTQGHFVRVREDGGECFCAEGAIDRVLYLADVETNWREFYRPLRTVIGSPYHSIVLWNDQDGRTHEEVLAAFDKAIELTESES